MGCLSAHFFAHVQGADFYRRLHEQAVALAGPGVGRTWFDIGCGPGLVARQAQALGYEVTGFDLDAAMLAKARRHPAAAPHPRYLQSDLAELTARHGRADVVSAASLLMVLPDRRAAMAQLMDGVAPGGLLLVVETGHAMSDPIGNRFQDVARGKRAWVLRLWARARRGVPFVNVAELCPPGCVAERHDLLGGLVHAWLVRRQPAFSGAEAARMAVSDARP